MDDFDLIRAIIGGDTKAWTTFVDRHAPKVTSAIQEVRGLLPQTIGADFSEDDISVEVFSSLLEDDCRRLRQVGSKADIPAWLTMIARRLSLKRSRNSKRYRRLSGVMEARGNEGLPQRESARADLVELPPRDRLVLELYFFEGLEPQVIADHVRIPASQIVRFLKAAIERMKVHLPTD